LELREKSAKRSRGEEVEEGCTGISPAQWNRESRHGSVTSHRGLARWGKKRHFAARQHRSSPSLAALTSISFCLGVVRKYYYLVAKKNGKYLDERCA